MPQSKSYDRWSKLSDAEKAFIEERLRSSGAGRTSPIPPRPRGRRIPLSSAQERLWFLDQLDPGTPTYNRPWALRLKGQLNLQVLEKCLHEIVLRHEALRTTFPEIDGQPYQEIQIFPKKDLDFIDLRDVSIEDREIRAIQLARKETRRPFDLTQDPMLRPFLIQMGETDHILLLTTHHIICDGWSEMLMFNELAKLYTAYSSSQPSPLIEPRIQYPDFAYWETNQMAETGIDILTDFWKGELQGAPHLLKLQTDRPRPSKLTHQGASQTIRVPDDLARSIKEFSQSHGTTLFMTLLSAFNIAIYLNSGETDIVVGTPVAGRKFSELEQMVGFFVNTLVLRNDLSGDPTFREFHSSVRYKALRAYEYQELAFGKLVEITNPPRSVNFSPIVQVTFSLRNIPIANTNFPDLEVEEFKFDSGISRFDLGLEAEDTPKGLYITMFYNLDLFVDSTVTRMLQQYLELITRLISNPDQKLSALPLHSMKVPEERKSNLQVDPYISNKSNLTGTQLLTWVGQKLKPNDPIYNLAYSVRIFNKIEPQHFQSALQELINSSDTLRTIFVEEESVPRRVVLPTFDYQMPLVDFSAEDQAEIALDDWISTRSHRQFNLERQSFDFALLKLLDGEWVWYLAIHHINGDNWAIQLILQRLQMFYEASLSGRLGDIQSFPQFETYFQYEKLHRASQKYKETELYWGKKFSHPVEPLSLYGSRRPKTESRSQRVSLDLGQELTQKLRELISADDFFTKSEEASLLNAFTTLFFAYFYRVSGNRDLAIATSFHNRRTPEYRETIGLFMEPLALRVKIAETETFTSLNKKVTEETIETLQYRQYPLRNPIHAPIYEVVLNFHKIAFPRFLDTPADFKRVHNHYDEDLLGIHIRDYEKSGSLTIDFDFNCAVFEPELRERVIKDYKQILEAFIADPSTQIDQVNLLSTDERRKVLFDFNKTAHPYLEKKIVTQLFEDQVIKSPNQIAVVKSDDELTYAQLNSRSNQVAHYLRSLGVQPDNIVGLHVERSIDMLVGMLAIHKSGAAYLPLDPNLPNERLVLMLKNSSPTFVLTQKHLKNQLPRGQAKVICLDDQKIFAKESTDNPASVAQPHNLAYVIFTSGSTGVPKGVMVEHRSLLNFTQWAREDWDLKPEDRMLQFTALSWDSHIEEIFPALTSGATIVLRSENMIDTFQGFLEQCRNLNITVLDLPTAYWQELTNAIERDDLELPHAIRLVLIGGEKTLKAHVETWLAKVGMKVRLLNDYGLTECTSIATQYDLREGIPSDATGVPTGLPVHNVQAYILDQHKNPVAIGLPGELWIGGNSLARGYLNDPQLTDEYFHPNHLSRTPGNRLLRTGDLARRLRDGNLEILGRVDQQVKILGYRVELGEIELALNEHPSIQETIAIILENLEDSSSHEHTEKRLVAYYTVKAISENDLSSSNIQEFLKKKLPDYMIPSQFIRLESFPLNPNGKVDRDALPYPEVSDLIREGTFLAPQTDLEKQLVAIWEDVLKVAPIGVTNNFFELGGHSLLAVRLFSMIEKELKAKLPLVPFFESPTVASQAKSIITQGSEDSQLIIAVEPKGDKPPFFCVSPTIIDVMTYIELSKNMGSDQPFYALYSQKLGQWRKGSRRREAIATQLIEKIQEVDPQGPYFIGGYSAGGVIALEIAQQMRKLNLDVKLLVLFDTFGPIPPTRLAWVTPWIFNALRVVRRVESYIWKFWLLDWKGKLNYLQIPRIRSWVRDRFKEVNVPQGPEQDGEEDPISLKHGEYTPEIYDGDVLLIRAKKGLLGVKQDLKMGWGEILTGKFEICIVPGDHEAILFGPRSRHVGAQLNAYLDAAQQTNQKKSTQEK